MTTEVLESWVAGRWQGGSGDGTVVRDAVTGDEVVRVTSDGLDLAEVARYAREVGGPALRALDFGQRAAVLKQVAAVGLLPHDLAGAGAAEPLGGTAVGLSLGHESSVLC